MAAENSIPDNRSRLLIVDDEAVLRKNIAKLLENRGIVVEQAESGEECLSILNKKSMDVVVLDVKMPGMNGIETLRRIKQKHPEIEVILLTGKPTTTDGVEGIKAGAFDYLSKPAEFEHLLSKINHAYEKIQWVKEKQREAEFMAKLKQQIVATERLASLGTLATGVAHEINNPLAIIKQSVVWLKLYLKRKETLEMHDRPDVERALENIETAIERARRITHQLLGFNNKNDSKFKEVNLKEMLEDTLQLANREIAHKNIEIVRQVDPKLDNFWSDPFLMRQALLNLLINAVHATHTKGKITIMLNSDDKRVEITIRDTGEGIPKENLDKIFEPFFTTKSPGKGTGLGLFVTRNIIETLGGTIKVESRAGQGTSFFIMLPKHPEFEMNQH